MSRYIFAAAFSLISGAASAVAPAVYPPGSKLPVYYPSQWTPKIAQIAKTKTGSLYYSIAVRGRAYVWEGATRAYSLTVPTPRTIRMELHQGDQNPWDASVGHSVDRGELCTRDLAAKVGQKIEVDYLFSVDPGAPIAAAWNVVGQLRQDVPSASPAFGFYFNGNDHLVAQVNYDAAPGSARPWTGKAIWTDPEPIVRGRRYRMQINARWHADGTGTITATRDGVQLFNYTGPTGYRTMKGVTWSFGWYRPASATEVEAASYGAMNVTNPR